MQQVAHPCKQHIDGSDWTTSKPNLWVWLTDLSINEMTQWVDSLPDHKDVYVEITWKLLHTQLHPILA